jgi:hypothetical protein
MPASEFPSARGYILPPDCFRRTDGRWKSVCEVGSTGKGAPRKVDPFPSAWYRSAGFTVLRAPRSSVSRPPRRLLVLAPQQQVDRLSDEGRDVPVLRVRHHLPHPVPRRLIETERDDQWLSNHSLQRRWRRGGTLTPVSIQNNSGLSQGFLPTLHGSLSLQQPAAGTVGRLVAIAKPRARHRTARVHHAARRRGGGLAARGARAARDARDWASAQLVVRRLAAPCNGASPRPEGSRLCRRSGLRD